MLAGIFNRFGEPVHGKRIFSANIDHTARCAHGIGAEDHTFKEHVRVGFDFVAVHVGSGVAFVRIADDVPFAWIVEQRLPHN